MFYWIFWITMITFVAVEATLVVFLIKYRRRPERKKAHFTHGNTRLELAWTIAPSIILAILALASKKIWDNYRYADPSVDDASRAKVLVIGQQFKWNFIYPGPDGKIGKYLLYPRPTDAKWPVDQDGKDQTYADVAGPASLNYKDAIEAINRYVTDVNPLGKDFSDPDGKDDVFDMQAGTRPLILPAHRPIEVQLSSKDVIHDFYLPNFRVKLDAVPGMRGRIYFTSTKTSAEEKKTTPETIPLDKLDAALNNPAGSDATIVIDENAPGTNQKNKDATGWRYVNPASPRSSIMRDGMTFGDPDTRKTRIETLKGIGLTEVKVNLVQDTGNWELVCEELCGQGHNTMTAVVTFLSPEEYDKLNLDQPYKPAAAVHTASAAQ
jgi:heme/copper-type cytochrome/quinol oxidase subunit 2